MVYTTVIFALLGAVFGSFLNAWLHRFEQGTSVLKGRSQCIACNRVLTWYELVPLVSFIVIRGTCTGCKARIPPRYFFVECATALVFASSAWIVSGRKEMTVLLAGVLLAGLVTLCIIFFFELYFGLVLTHVLLAATIVVALANFALGVPPLSMMYGAFVGAGFFFAQWWVSRGRWVGEGDIWIGLFIGLLLGWRFTILALLLAYVSGACVALALLAFKKVDRKSVIHFGVFLAVSGWVSWLYGNEVLLWYLQLMR